MYSRCNYGSKEIENNVFLFVMSHFMGEDCDNFIILKIFYQSVVECHSFFASETGKISIGFSATLASIYHENFVKSKSNFCSIFFYFRAQSTFFQWHLFVE